MAGLARLACQKGRPDAQAQRARRLAWASRCCALRALLLVRPTTKARGLARLRLRDKPGRERAGFIAAMDLLGWLRLWLWLARPAGAKAARAKAIGRPNLPPLADPTRSDPIRSNRLISSPPVGWLVGLWAQMAHCCCRAPSASQRGAKNTHQVGRPKGFSQGSRRARSVGE